MRIKLLACKTVPAQTVLGAGWHWCVQGRSVMSRSLVIGHFSTSCGKGTFRDRFFREKRWKRGGKGGAYSFCQHYLVWYMLRIIFCTVYQWEGAWPLQCTHLVPAAPSRQVDPFTVLCPWGSIICSQKAPFIPKYCSGISQCALVFPSKWHDGNVNHKVKVQTG